MNIHINTVNDIIMRLRFESEGFDPGSSSYVWRVYSYDGSNFELGKISAKVRSPSFRGDNERLAIGMALTNVLNSITLVHNDFGLKLSYPEEYKTLIEHLQEAW